MKFHFSDQSNLYNNLLSLIALEFFFPLVAYCLPHYPMLSIAILVIFKTQNSGLWCYIRILLGFIRILGTVYFLLKGRGK